MRSSGMLPAALILFASLANAQEYKSGINWPEPKVITPGTNGGAPSDAIVLFDGKDVTNLPTEARNIAQVFQFPVIYDTMTVGENLAFPLKNRGWKQVDIYKRVSQIAEILELHVLRQLISF